MPRGRPPKGSENRSKTIGICIEENLKTELEEHARGTRRSLSDYCRYVLEQHIWLMREQEGEAIVIDETEGLPPSL